MFRKTSLIFITTILCVNLHAQDVPNVAAFLPNPPTEESDLFICDNYVYTEAKSERDTPRGEQSKTDMVWKLADFIPFYANIIGIPESDLINSNIFELLYYGVTYGELSLKEAQNTYYHIRPYSYFNEPSLLPDEEDDHNDNSYPAYQSTIGWLCSLLLTEVCPSLQDIILKRGVDFGPSTVISGYNWDSDAYAGYLLASAVLSRLHTHKGFNTMVSYAQSDYKRLANSRGTRFDDTPYLDTDERPDPVIYLPAPPADNSAKYNYDYAKYQEGKSLRSTKVGQQAIADVEYSTDNFCHIYSQVLGVAISASKTPAIYELVSRVHPSGNAATQLAKAYYHRLRPYVQLKEPTSYPADEEHLKDTGSYPSGHASGSWLMALVFSEVAQTRQDALLARAYQFGQGRVITGYHWQTDVDYGRLVGSAVYARLHADKDFLSQMEKAINEYKTLYTGIDAVSTTTHDADAPVYTLEGVRLTDKATRPGIYIQGKRKIIIK